MARRVLGPVTLKVVQAVSAVQVAPARRLLVACSGGADSLALAAGAKLAARHTGLATGAIIIDHGLQRGSDVVAELVTSRLQALGFQDVQQVAVDVQESGQGPEAAAREARYAALTRAADEQDAAVLLGHTLDDQAETVLLGLARGSGTRSLAGMPAVRGPFRRPLLGLRRADTRACCAELGLTPWDDPHNADPSFTRVRVRDTVLPMLESELGPGIVEALARTAQQAGVDADALDELAEGVLQRASRDGGLDAADLMQCAAAVRRRVLLRWLRSAGARDVSFGHLMAVDALLTDWRGQRGIDVPGLRVVRRAGQLCAVAG